MMAQANDELAPLGSAVKSAEAALRQLRRARDAELRRRVAAGENGTVVGRSLGMGKPRTWRVLNPDGRQEAPASADAC